MVRLFVRAGEGEHALVPRQPEPLPANPYFYSIPEPACYGAALTTGILSILGRSRPGTFLRSVAVWTPLVAYYNFGAFCLDHEFRKYIRAQGMELKPWKLIEWTGGITMDTCALAGGIAGLALASTRRAFPGVSGWRRYLGAAQVGCAVGYMGSRDHFESQPAHFKTMMQFKASQQKEEAAIGDFMAWSMQLSEGGWTSSFLPLFAFPGARLSTSLLPQRLRIPDTKFHILSREDGYKAPEGVIDSIWTEKPLPTGEIINKVWTPNSPAPLRHDPKEIVARLEALDQEVLRWAGDDMRYIRAVADIKERHYHANESGTDKRVLFYQIRLLQELEMKYAFDLWKIQNNIMFDIRWVTGCKNVKQRDIDEKYVPEVWTEQLRERLNWLRSFKARREQQLESLVPGENSPEAIKALAMEEPTLDQLEANLKATEQLLKELEDHAEKAIRIMEEEDYNNQRPAK